MLICFRKRFGEIFLKIPSVIRDFHNCGCSSDLSVQMNVSCVSGQMLKMLVFAIPRFGYRVQLSEFRQYGRRKLLVNILVYELADIRGALRRTWTIGPFV